MSSIDCDFNINSYDLIAIDMDNSLVKYKLMNSLSLIHHLLQNVLIKEYNYPKDICEEFCPKFCQKGLVVDKKRGNILKLNSHYDIMSAKHGIKDLDEEEIRKIYNKLYEELKQIPQLLALGTIYTTIGFEFCVLRDYFQSPLAQVFSKIVEVMDGINAFTVDYEKIWKHVFENGVICYNNDPELCFGRELSLKPDKYFHKSSQQLIELLKDLRKGGKLVVMISSSKVNAMKFIMNYSFEDNWNKCFDIVITIARKPMFFTSDRKFSFIDSIDDNIQRSVDFDGLELGQIYSEGNWNQLKSFAAKHLSKSDPKCLYIGDSFNDDCIVPNKYVNCDTVAIVEELEEELRPEFDTSYWKSFFGDQNNVSLWYELIKRHSKLIVPKIDCIVDYYDSKPNH